MVTPWCVRNKHSRDSRVTSNSTKTTVCSQRNMTIRRWWSSSDAPFVMNTKPIQVIEGPYTLIEHTKTIETSISYRTLYSLIEILILDGCYADAVLERDYRDSRESGASRERSLPAKRPSLVEIEKEVRALQVQNYQHKEDRFTSTNSGILRDDFNIHLRVIRLYKGVLQS
jgi:hypothetical protein